MKNSIYLYSQESLSEIIKKILIDYTVHTLTLDQTNDSNFKNNNTLLVLKNDTTNEIKKSFFSNNNVVVFFFEQTRAI